MNIKDSKERLQVTSLQQGKVDHFTLRRWLILWHCLVIADGIIQTE